VSQDDDYWRAPLQEKQAKYWVPSSAFDWETGGRALSEEERRIARRLQREAVRIEEIWRRTMPA
jgi:hypothetical protein